MKISQISIEQVPAYLSSLKMLIDQTIDMPEKAKDKFKNQWTEEGIIANLDEFVFTAAWEGDKVLGLILGTPPEGGVATIIWVLVAPLHQGKSIGRQLFAHAKESYINKGAHKVKLTVPDEKTVNFYIKQGMVLEGTHRNHWWGMDFWAMGLQLLQ